MTSIADDTGHRQPSTSERVVPICNSGSEREGREGEYRPTSLPNTLYLPPALSIRVTHGDDGRETLIEFARVPTDWTLVRQLISDLRRAPEDRTVYHG